MASGISTEIADAGEDIFANLEGLRKKRLVILGRGGGPEGQEGVGSVGRAEKEVKIKLKEKGAN